MIWELIRSNKRKSIILLFLMAAVLLSLGAALGFAFAGPRGLPFGMLIAAGVYLILTLISFAGGDQILLSACKAKPITKDMHPQLYNVVEEMSIAAQLPKIPNIYIIPDPSPNAFATGRNPNNASIAVTAGLLGRLNRDELQGVIAHEMSHILHRDILYVTLAGVMLGAIIIISDVFLRSMFYSSMMGSRRRYSSRDNQGGGAALMIIIAIIAAILAPIFAQILYFSLSRRREYLADAGGARLTRYPEGLASALEKISKAHIPMETANKATAPMYIAPPFSADGMAFAGIGHTHPPIEKRVQILRNMTHGTSYKDYSAAFASITGQKSYIPKSALKDEQVEIKKQQPHKSDNLSQKQQTRQIGDIIRMANGFAFLTCSCGLKMKIPPNYKAKKVQCPKCNTIHSI
jgi:heat shock protein HtpX